LFEILEIERPAGAAEPQAESAEATPIADAAPEAETEAERKAA